MAPWTTDALLAVLGIGLSMAQWLIPPFKKFQQQLGDWTPLFSAGVLLMISIGALGFNCNFLWGCIAINFASYWSVFASAMVAYYSSYSGIVKPVNKLTFTKQQAALIARSGYPQAQPK